jgi:hypothetical protein
MIIFKNEYEKKNLEKKPKPNRLKKTGTGNKSRKKSKKNPETGENQNKLGLPSLDRNITRVRVKPVTNTTGVK